MTTISANNRQIQKSLEFYTSKSEISEALFELGKAFSPASMKYISHYKYTDGGVTQASVKELCKLSGISTSTYSGTVKPEIETLLGEPIIYIEKTQKNDKSRTKRVKGCTYKILIPLRKIKYLIMKYLKQKRAQELAKIKEVRARISSFSDNDIESDINTDIESNAQTPRQDSAESDFLNEQNKSFRENPLEKSFNKLTITKNFITKNFGKIKIKNDVKNYLNTFPLFRDFAAWTESKRYEIAKTIQFAIIKTETDIQEDKPQHMIRKAVNRFMDEYADKPKNEFFRLLYTFVFNALKKDQVDDSENKQDDSEDEYQTLVPREILEERASRQELDDQGVW